LFSDQRHHAITDEGLKTISRFGMLIAFISLSWFVIQALTLPQYSGVIGCVISIMWMVMKIRLLKLRNRTYENKVEQQTEALAQDNTGDPLIRTPKGSSVSLVSLEKQLSYSQSFDVTGRLGSAMGKRTLTSN
jgi:hypothetical protein